MKLSTSILSVALLPTLSPGVLGCTAAPPDAGESTGGEAPAPPVDPANAIALGAHLLDVSRPLPELPEPLRARPPGADAKSHLSAIGASWSGPFHPAYKLSRAIAEVQAEGEALLPVMVHVLPDATLPSVLSALRGLGVRNIVGQRADSSFSRVRLLLTRAEIAALREPLAALRDVFWIELEGRRVLLDDTTVWVGQSGLSGGQTTPIFSRGIYGEGQTVAVIDTGIDADSCFFCDPALGPPPTNVCDGGTVVNRAQRKVVAVDFLWSAECAGGIATNEWDSQGHGTHVAGIVAGDNFAHRLTHDSADGMAPGAQLVIQDAGWKTDSCADLPGIGCPVVDMVPIFQQAYDQGARLHTNSWGDNEDAPVQNNYSATSQDVDQFMWEHKDDLILFAAGNTGPGAGSVGSPSTNKNGLSVGATLRGTAAESMASFSSCGATADGRLKPDLTVPGANIVSAGNDRDVASNNCDTATMSGTSMATPGAAGFAALARQYYMDGWYPSGSKTRGDGFTPSGALLKASLVNSAVNMADSPAIPSSCQGWGRVLLENVLFFTGQPRKLWVKDDDKAFATGSTNEDRTYRFDVTSIAEPFKVTLAWTDFPSTPAARTNLNNDIDLIVVGPGGTFLGNAFSSGVSTTGGTADRLNNLEQVLLGNPTIGAYTVTVRSFNVPNGPQPFALVVTGAMNAL